jgi:hypothetical protein
VKILAKRGDLDEKVNEKSATDIFARLHEFSQTVWFTSNYLIIHLTKARRVNK